METSPSVPDTTVLQPLPIHSEVQSLSFIISPNEDYATSIEALLALEIDCPSLQVSTRITTKRDYTYSSPKSLKPYKFSRIPSFLATKRKKKSVSIALYTTPPKKTIMILEGYTLGFPLDRLCDHPLVKSASRLEHCLSRKASSLSLWWTHSSGTEDTKSLYTKIPHL